MKECEHYSNWCEKEKRTCKNCYYERGYNMTDEEMKAIDLLKNIDKQKCIMLECPVVKNNIERQLKIIELNRIIRKQSKEIEELKYKNNKLIQCHFKYEEMTGIDLLLEE